MASEGLAPCILMICSCFFFPILTFASFWDPFWKLFRIVSGSTFQALGGQTIVEMTSTIDTKIDIGKSRFRGRTTANKFTGLVGLRGGGAG